MQVNFKHWVCRAQFERYASADQIAITLLLDDNDPSVMAGDEIPGDDVAVATICAPEVTLRAGRVLIKDYSENSGMVDALVAAGVVESDVESHYVTGFCSVPVMRLTPQALALVPAS